MKITLNKRRREAGFFWIPALAAAAKAAGAGAAAGAGGAAAGAAGAGGAAGALGAAGAGAGAAGAGAAAPAAGAASAGGGMSGLMKMFGFGGGAGGGGGIAPDMGAGGGAIGVEPTPLPQGTTSGMGKIMGGVMEGLGWKEPQAPPISPEGALSGNIEAPMSGLSKIIGMAGQATGMDMPGLQGLGNGQFDMGNFLKSGNELMALERTFPQQQAPKSEDIMRMMMQGLPQQFGG